MSHESVKMDNEGSNDLRHASRKQLANLLRDLLDADDSTSEERRSDEISTASSNEFECSRKESQAPADPKV